MAIDGTWINLFGSKLTLASNGTSITGTYQPPNGSALPLVGWINSADNDPAVGWTVLSGAGGNDATTWSGQYYADGSPETIIAFWVQQTQPASGVAAPAVGKDFFGRLS